MEEYTEEEQAMREVMKEAGIDVGDLAPTPKAPAEKTLAQKLKIKKYTPGNFNPRPPSWLWRRLIKKGTINIITGPGDSGKTYLSLMIAARFILGLSFCGKPCDAAGSRRKVLFLSGEDDADTYMWRLDNIMHAIGEEMKAPFSHVEASVLAAIEFTDEASDIMWSGRQANNTVQLTIFGNWLKLYISEQQIGLCVVDSRTAFFSAIDEFAQLGRALYMLKDIARETGCTFVVLDHVSQEAVRNGGSVFDATANRGGTAGINAAKGVFIYRKLPGSTGPERIFAVSDKNNHLAPAEKEKGYVFVLDPNNGVPSYSHEVSKAEIEAGGKAAPKGNGKKAHHSAGIAYKTPIGQLPAEDKKEDNDDPFGLDKLN